MKKSRKIVSMPIISIVEGIQIGTVKGLVINPAAKEVAALIVDQKGWFRAEKIVPYTKVAHVGDDAITIDQSVNVQKPTNLPEILKLLQEKTDPIGMRVISEKGKVIGYIDEYYIDEQTGEIVSLEITGRFIEGLMKGKGLLTATEILTMGTDAIVVKTGTEDKITKLDGGLQETLTTLKDGTTELWSNTRQKTIELSKTLKEKTKQTTDKVKLPKIEFGDRQTETEQGQQDDDAAPMKPVGTETTTDSVVDDPTGPVLSEETPIAEEVVEEQEKCEAIEELSPDAADNNTDIVDHQEERENPEDKVAT